MTDSSVRAQPTSSYSTLADRYVLALCALLPTLFLLRAITIDVASFQNSFDEAQYWAWSHHLDFGYFNKPPLIACLIRSATAVCGNNQACVRLHGRRVGFWSAVVYALMPGIAVPSLPITTDVPLLFVWIIGLLAFMAHFERARISAALIFGLAMGLGFDAKHEMIYLPLAAGLYVAFTPSRRWMARDPWTWLGLAIAVAPVVPISPRISRTAS